jgi:hypothetical protein
MSYLNLFNTFSQNGALEDVAQEAALILVYEHYYPQRIRSKQEQQIISNAWGYTQLQGVKGVGDS